MSKITSEEVEKIASLARLKLSAQEALQAASDLSGVLRHFSTIADISTEGVRAADDASGLPAGRQGLKNIARADEVKSELLGSHTDIMKQVPEVKDNYVQVAGVFSSQDTL